MNDEGGVSAGSTSYRKDPRETTEWDDIQRKLGNLPPLPEPEKAEEVEVEVDPETVRAARLDAAAADELDEFEDEFVDDRFYEMYREKRLAELRSKAASARFGEVCHRGVPLSARVF